MALKTRLNKRVVVFVISNLAVTDDEGDHAAFTDQSGVTQSISHLDFKSSDEWEKVKNGEITEFSLMIVEVGNEIRTEETLVKTHEDGSQTFINADLFKN